MKTSIKNLFSTPLFANWITEKERNDIPPRDLWVSPKDSFIHFMRWPWEFRSYLTLICGLKPTDKILEIGCHHGRTAYGLKSYLKKPGKYYGLDILEKQIDWAKEHYNQDIFNFQCADMLNGMYNPTGKINSNNYYFPYKNEQFDVVFAASVCTHLLPDTLEHYFSEIHRVARFKARILLSFCLLDSLTESSNSPISDLYAFSHVLEPGVFVKNEDLPEILIGYSVKKLEKMLKKNGLVLNRIYPGYWNNSDYSVNEQDLVLVQKV